MRRLLTERPWLLVIAAFFALIVAWAVLITIAERHRPEAIPLPPPGAARP